MCRILVAEDERNIRFLVDVLLRQRGCDVTEAENGQVALQRLTETCFDLLITDSRMPELDGLGLIDQVKQTYPALPIIIMTAYEADGQVGLHRGANGLLRKPFTRAALLEALQAINHWDLAHSAGV